MRTIGRPKHHAGQLERHVAAARQHRQRLAERRAGSPRAPRGAAVRGRTPRRPRAWHRSRPPRMPSPNVCVSGEPDAVEHCPGAVASPATRRRAPDRWPAAPHEARVRRASARSSRTASAWSTERIGHGHDAARAARHTGESSAPVASVRQTAEVGDERQVVRGHQRLARAHQLARAAPRRLPGSRCGPGAAAGRTRDTCAGA